ncbi:NADH:ubiquinone oxidoreductase subunit 6 (chain J) [Desulfocapsa sulfexigens DSM 10523]|uniref:NADH-quinone oxidoreductase subunit J n=1 Tax=Desulfocapsa sulfexigens (strain DSM 10523 / SB164P1) TaxID=1167006 RepID=M1NKG4_DESSD|nr:NADH-quinone oxidoreductase subunit J [Desulfocapsa sulfexigens]AGF80079.1 NADH:ubiquinone oxidoreductase subunit 6 (chain J) [Desulfocapsa sulfexigens DSM 10523]
MNPTDTSGVLGFFMAEGLAGYADAASGIVFLVMLAAIVIGGIIACNSERLVRAVAGLALCFIGVAGIYYFLNSPFVSMMQILIYVGAVCITIAFAIMLASPEENKKQGPAGPLSGPLGLITAGLVTFGMIGLAVNTSFTVLPKENMGSIQRIGSELLTSYSMVFELVSIVLLIAIIGSLVIARHGRSK